jgi:hypothetical protein
MDHKDDGRGLDRERDADLMREAIEEFRKRVESYGYSFVLAVHTSDPLSNTVDACTYFNGCPFLCLGLAMSLVRDIEDSLRDN